METIGEVLKKYRPDTPGQERPGAAISSSARSDAAPADAVCSACGDIGWVRRDVSPGEPDFGKLFPCQCRLEQFETTRLGRLMRWSNLGSLQGVTFASMAEEAQRNGRQANPLLASALEIARQYADRPSGWLAIEGPPGSGKTRVAAAIANACIARGVATLFLPVADLLDHLRSTYAPTSDVAYDELFDQIRNVPVLILDDLGTESATPWAREKLSQLLSHRYSSASPTVITTDVPLDKVEERIRARLADPAVSRLVRLAAPAARTGRGIDQLDLVLPHMTFETFNADGMGLRGAARQNLHEALALARRFAQQPEGWLVYIGQHGCGKSHLASAIANYCRQRGDDVVFLLVPKFLDYLRSLASQPGGPSYDALDRAERCGLLVLDDFSESVETPWTREKLDQLLNFRGLTRLPTVVTSSLSPDSMEPRIWSRMYDPRLSNVYEISAPDYRTGTEKGPARTAEGPRSGGRGRGPRHSAQG